jgi:hypothetical protein
MPCHESFVEKQRNRLNRCMHVKARTFDRSTGANKLYV